MNIVQEFSRFANQYESYNIVQSQVADKLISMVAKQHYSSVIDIGCGSGSIYKNMLKHKISFDSFTALDLSKEMLKIHPSSLNIEKICFDFNNKEDFKKLDSNYELLLSSSALQWSEDLEMTIKETLKLSSNYYLSFFTSNTFATLHQIAGIKSPIYSQEQIKETITRYTNCSFETVEYRLPFDSVKDMFKYIKRSGVSGGKKQLNYKQMREIMQNYPLEYLEFEVLFVF